MVKSYPGWGQVILILFFVIIGIWMFINPMLNNFATIDKLNYGGLVFTGIGISLTFILKKVIVWKEGIQIKHLIVRKQIIISRSEISQITIEDDEPNLIEVLSSNRRKPRRKIKIQFKTPGISELVLRPNINTSYYKVRKFLRENYAELINEQEFVYE